MRLLKLAAALVILLVAGLAGYAYFGDMSSAPREMRMPVALDLGAPDAALPATPAENPPATQPAAKAAAPAAGATGTAKDDLD